MWSIGLLILLPLAASISVLRAPDAHTRDRRVRSWSIALIALTLVVGIGSGLGSTEHALYVLPPWLQTLLDGLFHLVSLLLLGVLLYLCRHIKGHEWYIPALILVQTGILFLAEAAAPPPKVEHPFATDPFAILMALIIGVVGGLIALHAVPYMRDYHNHAPEVPDRRAGFYAVIFLFLAAMFGLVFANQLHWLFVFWEITTFCSFWLIAYPKTDEALRNAYRALGFNLIGGLAFAAALLWLTMGPGPHTWALDRLIGAGQLALLPAALIAVAGLAKSAQLPFSSWLLGAMVAPTPVSALLHSSTMVKAGVFILVKLAPVFHGTLAGLLLALIGGLTFVLTSLAAVNQRNAKRVLAYSTIANLGLIVMCAAVGTAEALWAAILLILFHALAKALLFLGVGSIEHLIGSRDIEDMEGLVYRRPELAAMLLIGILGMFLAPFGMLLSKYTSLQAFLRMDLMPGEGALLAAILAFGSGPTLFFWGKWMGRLVAKPHRLQPIATPPPRDEQLVLGNLTALTALSCALFPLIELGFAMPYTQGLAALGLIPAQATVIPWETVGIMTLMLVGLFALPLAFWLRPPSYVETTPYLSGANVGEDSYRGAMGSERLASSHGYYLTGFFAEPRLMRLGVLGTLALGLAMLGVSL